MLQKVPKGKLNKFKLITWIQLVYQPNSSKVIIHSTSVVNLLQDIQFTWIFSPDNVNNTVLGKFNSPEQDNQWRCINDWILISFILALLNYSKIKQNSKILDYFCIPKNTHVEFPVTICFRQKISQIFNKSIVLSANYSFY